MELFPAADQKQLDFIKRVIDDCDYYVLIIAGRYGSISETGLSFTEQEYEYAVSRGMPVMAFLHENPEEIPIGKSEKDPASQGKLQQFRARVSNGRLVKTWKNAADLPALVATTLANTTRMFPAVGWVRANRVATEEVLADINELRKSNDHLRNQNEELRAALADLNPSPPVEGLAQLDEEVQASGTYWDAFGRKYRKWTITTTWRKMFAYISPYLSQFPSESTVKEILNSALYLDFHNANRMTSENDAAGKLDDQFFQTVGIQLEALGLIKLNYSQTTTGGMAMFWVLTGYGRKLMVELRTVRTKVAKDSA
jgi:hypothetical protein